MKKKTCYFCGSPADFSIETISKVLYLCEGCADHDVLTHLNHDLKLGMIIHLNIMMEDENNG